MESKTKFLGHPIHPMLINFPIGLLVTAVIFDILFLLDRSDFFSTVSFYNIAAGVIGGLLAAIFGSIDYLALPSKTRAKRIGLWHGLGNVVVLLLFSFSWIIRRNNEGLTPETLALLASFLGVAVAGMTAWMGGELVNRLGVGVDQGANLNAPSSLITESTRPLQREQIPVTGEQRELDRESVQVPHSYGSSAQGDDGDAESTGRIIDEP